MSDPVRPRMLAVTTLLLLLVLLAAGLQRNRPSYALPLYSRRYDVTCQACHTVAPHLNKFGLAFQDNHFHWPGGPPPALHAGPASARSPSSPP